MKSSLSLSIYICIRERKIEEERERASVLGLGNPEGYLCGLTRTATLPTPAKPEGHTRLEPAGAMPDLR